MLAAYKLSATGPVEIDASAGIPAETDWVDLMSPTPEEDKAAEAFLGASLPTREESLEIEFSSRFYTEDGAVFMTTSLLTGVDVGKPVIVPFTMVLAGERMVTLRYDELRAIKLFLARAAKPENACHTVASVFSLMIEAIIERSADVIEKISANVDQLNREIFDRTTASGYKRDRRLELVIGDIGTQNDIAAKIRESLASLERLVQFAGVVLPGAFEKGQNRARLKLVARDIRTLEDHVLFLSTKISFLLDATLGLISVDQNEVIRVLTIVATFFFPPTLIATIYGMNFKWMPELDWYFGYPASILLMLVSVLIPYIYFKRKHWL
jgi:magnesium transporter